MSTLKASNIQPQSDSDPLIVSTNATQRVRVGSDGLVGIGTSSPLATLHVDGTSRVSDSGVKPSGGNAVFSVVSTVPVTAATTEGITLASFLSNNASGSDYRPRLFVTATKEGIVLNESYNTTATNLMFAIGHVEKMRLTANGEIGIGTTSPVAKLDVRGTVSISDRGVFPTGSAAPLYNRLLVGGTGAAIFVWDDGSSVAAGRYGRIGMGSRNSQSGVTLAGGYIDGGNEGTTDHSGFLKFFTTPADGSSNVERMRITSNGYVGIATTNPTATLTVGDGTYSSRTDYAAEFTSDGNDAGFGGVLFSQNSTNAFKVWTEGTGNATASNNKFLIDAIIKSTGLTLGSRTTPLITIRGHGTVGINKMDPEYALDVFGVARFNNNINSNKVYVEGFGDSLGYGIRLDPATMTNARPLVFFNTSATMIGSISHPTTTSTAYNTSSDYRMKENVVSMTGGLGRIQSLKPCVFTWKQDGSLGEGFLAHELAEVVPLAVTGQKDAVDETGQINPQQVDMAKVVPVLVSAVQELKNIVDSQAARIAELEAR